MAADTTQSVRDSGGTDAGGLVWRGPRRSEENARAAGGGTRGRERQEEKEGQRVPERYTDPRRARVSLQTALLLVLSACGVTRAATFPPFVLLLAGLCLWRVKGGRSTGVESVRHETRTRVGKTAETAASTKDHKS